MALTGDDWDPEAYGRFRGLRLRPARDLLAQVTDLPPGGIVDLGCGDGALGPLLAARFPGRRLTGVDRSPAMRAQAAACGCYAAVVEADIGLWEAAAPVALVFSNAALHWVGDHDALLPKLAGQLVPGGMLAVQMPRQFGEPSHRFLRDIAAALFPGRFDFAAYVPPVRTAEAYWRLLSPHGAVDAWETEHVQRLEPGGAGHPVRRFTESTAMRPFVEKLTEAEVAAFAAAYDAALGSAYPTLADGAALMPFRRVFLTLRV